jgi:segregation and condensation protein B
MNLLNQHIEALIFCSEQSISIDEIAASLKLSYDWDLSDEQILNALETIREKYASEDFPFYLEEISEGYQFLSKKEFHATISALIQHKAKKKLSVAQMETLSIIAYKQPITKSEVEHIRGVNCDYAIHKLLEKDMISISGKSEGAGRPVLYSTSKNFMDYFGIQNPKDLPQLKDLHLEQNEIGVAAEFNGDETVDDTALTPESEVVENAGEVQAGEVLMESEEQHTRAESEMSPEALTNAGTSVDNLSDADEEDDLMLPDRKAIFIESQLKTDQDDIESANDKSEEADDTLS